VTPPRSAVPDHSIEVRVTGGEQNIMCALLFDLYIAMHMLRLCAAGNEHLLRNIKMKASGTSKSSGKGASQLTNLP
jgi:hypothetical protein